MLRLGVCGFALAVSIAGCAIVLPAREQPARIEPSLAPPSAPPASGNGRIYIDVADGPARVERLGGPTPQLVCLSPCWAELPIGHHDLRFILQKDPFRIDADVVKVFEQPLVYRRALGKTEFKAGHKTVAVLGTIFGLSLLSTAGLLAAGDSGPAGGLAIAGGVATAVGVYFAFTGRTIHQPGAWNSWPANESAAEPPGRR